MPKPKAPQAAAGLSHHLLTLNTANTGRASSINGEQPRRYFDNDTAAAYIGVSPSWLAHTRCPSHDSAGRGPRWIQPSGTRRIIYDVVDLDAWMASHKRGAIPTTPSVTIPPAHRRGRPTKAEQIARRLSRTDTKEVGHG